jgi:arylsulfatase A-like enzyme
MKDAAFTQVQRGMFPGYSVRSGKWRYMLWDGGAKGEQLYDLENDPAETTNLAADPKHADVVKELKAKIEKTLSRT